MPEVLHADGALGTLADAVADALGVARAGLDPGSAPPAGALRLVDAAQLPPEDAPGEAVLAVLAGRERGLALAVRPEHARAAAARLRADPLAADPRDPFLSVPRGARVGATSTPTARTLRWLRVDAEVLVGAAADLLDGLEADAATPLDAVVLTVREALALGRAEAARRPLPPPLLAVPLTGLLALVGPFEPALRERALPLDHRPAHLELIAERALLAAFADAGGAVLVAEARARSGRLELMARVFPPGADAPSSAQRAGEASTQGALRLAHIVARELREAGAEGRA